MKSGKILTIILFSLSVVLFLAGSIFVILLNIPHFYPSSLEIIENNGKIYLQSSKNESGYGYIFKFAGENDTLSLESDLNILDISQIYKEYDEIVLGKEYSISVSYKGEISGGDSPYSKPITWIAKTYLEAPSVYLNEGTLCWRQVTLADKYKIYYSDKDVQLITETNQTSFELKNLVGGVHNVFVTALSSSEHRMESAPSNILQDVKIVHEIAKLQSASYSTQTGMLTVYSHEKLTALKLISNDKENILKRLEFIPRGAIYVCSIDISLVPSGRMQVCPYPEDSYNIYTGDMTQVSIN